MPQFRCPNCHNLFEWPSNSCPHCNMKISLAIDKAKPLYCSNCGEELYEGKQFCPSCGSDQSIKEIEQPVVVEVKQETRNNGTTIASTITGSIAAYLSGIALWFFYIFGFMGFASMILGIIATIMGAINCKRNNNAKAGMILGIISIVMSIVAMILFAGVVVGIILLLKRLEVI